MAYEPTIWANNGAPAINADNLNKLEQGVADANEPVSYNNLLDKPTLLVIGTTASTAKAGNWKPAIADLPTGATATTVALGNHTHAVATTSAAGFMASTDKTKLDNLKGVILATRPTITITDPPDDENLQAAVDAILDYIDEIIGR